MSRLSRGVTFAENKTCENAPQTRTERVTSQYYSGLFHDYSKLFCDYSGLLRDHLGLFGDYS